jgi:hypothetical protein
MAATTSRCVRPTIDTPLTEEMTSPGRSPARAPRDPFFTDTTAERSPKAPPVTSVMPIPLLYCRTKREGVVGVIVGVHVRMLEAGCVNGPTPSTSQAGCEEQDPQTSGVQVSRCRDECRATKTILLQHKLVRPGQGVLRRTSPSPDCVMPLDKCCTSPARSIARENSSPAVASICLASPRDLSAIDRPLT